MNSVLFSLLLSSLQPSICLGISERAQPVGKGTVSLCCQKEVLSWRMLSHFSAHWPLDHSDCLQPAQSLWSPGLTIIQPTSHIQPVSKPSLPCEGLSRLSRDTWRYKLTFICMSVSLKSRTVWTQEVVSSVEFSGLSPGQNYCAVANFSFPTFSMAASPQSDPGCVETVSKFGKKDTFYFLFYFTIKLKIKIFNGFLKHIYTQQLTKNTYT